LARSGASRRSNLAGDIGDIGDIASNAGSASSVITSSWKRRSLGTNSAMIGANRFLVGTPSTAQQNQSAAMISAPEIRHRGGPRPHRAWRQGLPGMVTVPASAGAPNARIPP